LTYYHRGSDMKTLVTGRIETQIKELEAELDSIDRAISAAEKRLSIIKAAYEIRKEKVMLQIKLLKGNLKK